MFTPNSKRATLRAALLAHIGQEFTTAQVRRLSSAGRNTTHHVLAKMQSAGEVKRTGTKPLTWRVVADKEVKQVIKNNGGRPLKVNRLRFALLGRHAEVLTAAEIQRQYGTSRSTTYTVLRDMERRGEVEHLGWRNTARWHIICGIVTPAMRMRELAGWPPLETWELLQ